MVRAALRAGVAFVPESEPGGGVESVGGAFTVGGSSGSGGAFSDPGEGAGAAGSVKFSAPPGVDAGDVPFAPAFVVALEDGAGEVDGAGAGSGGLESSGVATIGFLLLSFFNL